MNIFLSTFLIWKTYSFIRIEVFIQNIDFMANDQIQFIDLKIFYSFTIVKSFSWNRYYSIHGIYYMT